MDNTIMPAPDSLLLRSGVCGARDPLAGRSSITEG
jgi:hypothetical protein